MKVQVSDQQNKVVFEVNDSDASKDLIKQLPLTTKLENYNDDEKIFYPQKLKTDNTPISQGRVGDLAYFAPWGDVVLYYKNFQAYPGLYQLGKCVFGKDKISKLKGIVTINLVK